MTTMSLEIHVKSRGDLKPDPKLDPVIAIFYFVHQEESTDRPNHCGILIQSQILPSTDLDLANCNNGTEKCIAPMNNQVLSQVHELKQILSSHCSTSNTNVLVVGSEEQMLRELILLVRR